MGVNPNVPNTITLTSTDFYQNVIIPEAGLDNEYELVEGVAVLPVAETPPTDSTLATWSPVEVVRLHAPFRIRKARFKTTKTGNAPVIPSPESQGAFKFLGAAMQFATPKVNAGLVNFDWTVGGQMTFVETVVSRPQDGYVLGALPWVYQTQVDNLARGGGVAPTYGAAAQAGLLVQLGYGMGTQIDPVNDPKYLYNEPSYFPGTLQNSTLMNGGAASVPPVQTPPQN